MRYLSIIIVSLFAIGLASAEKSSTKSTKLEARDKRFATSYGRLEPEPLPNVPAQRRISTGFYNEPQQSSYYPTTGGSSDVYTQTTYHHQHAPPQHYPQYIEAPEPIIEIIIKDSNDTLEVPEEPVVLPGQKKKKEQVQVFYVKYKHDPEKGVIIDDPVAALTPNGYQQEAHEEDYEEPQNDEPLIVTLPPPTKTTTLRTIIHPDSEKFHSNSGIHVTFGTEDKSQKGHQLQEEIEETGVQPVIALPTATVAPQTHKPLQASQHHQQNYNSFQQQQPQQQQKNQFQSNEFHSRFGQQARYYNTNNNNEVFPPLGQGLVNGNQQLPFVNTPSQPFRLANGQVNQAGQLFPLNGFGAQASTYPRPPPFQQPRQADHERNLVGSSAAPFVQQLPSFGTPPPFRKQGPPQGFQGGPPHHHHHNHHHQQRPHGPPPPAPTFSQPPPQQPVRFPQQGQNNGNNNFQNQKYRPNPIPSAPPTPQASQQPPQHRPIPIPLHQFDQQKPQQQQQQQQQNGQNFNHQQPPHFNGPSAPFRTREPLHVPVNPPQQFNQFNNNAQPPLTPIQGGGLVQQAAPNLSREQPQPHHQLQVQQQQQQYQQQQQQYQNNNQQQQQNHNSVLSGIRDIAAGGELIPSVAKYEQHIIEQAPTYHVAPQQQVNYNPAPISSSTVAPQKQNIGPLANNIGHLNHFGSSTVAPLRPSQPEIQPNFGSSVHQQQYIQQQISHALQEPTQQQSQQQAIQPQIIPNSQPITPGQGVSTHYAEVFPTLEQQRQQYYKSFISNQPQDQLQQVVINGRHNGQGQGQIYESSSIYTPTTSFSTTTPRATPSVAPVTTTTTTTARPVKSSNVNLPAEVPDDLRQQLLSSGILDNADISILDYDKIGGTNLDQLPPEHLANFFNAGGGAQISSSNQVLTVVKPNGEKVNLDYNNKEKLQSKKSADKALPQKQNVDLKVVRFDSTNQKSVAEKYIKSESPVLPTVEVGTENGGQYNRYLPLKLNGAQFPIPDVPELRGKRITSVVVLAPVDSNNLNGDQVDDGRYERDVVENKPVKFIAGDSLKQLIKKPTKENFKKWLEQEANTEIDFQSVVLLVAKDPQSTDEEKEIFMYDISTQSVNKLSGELSSAFVNVAESNAKADNIENAQIVDSGIVEQMDTESTLAGEQTSTTQRYFGDDDFVEKEIQDRLDDLEGIQYEVPVINSGYSVIKN